MPSEPIPWDRKDFFKERKHDRFESPARWRDSSSHYGSREFSRWGSAEFRRTAGHGKQGGWHLFPEESAHGYAPSRSSDKILEEDNCRPAVSRGDGKYGRSNRENRGSFSQRDWRGHPWETSNGSLNLPRRQLDVNNDLRSVDDMITYSSHPRSDFVNTWEQHHLKDQHNKMGGANGFGTSQRYDRESSLGSIDWKPLKWTRSGSLSARGSGFSHSSSSRSIRGADSCERKAELQHKNATIIESNSREAAAYATSSAPSEETNSRKKPRLNWGEGLAKFEKKKVEGPDVRANKDGHLLSPTNMEPSNMLSPSLVDKSPKVTGFSDCASPATPSSVACSSSPGVDDKLFVKAANVDNDASNLSGSPGPGSPKRFSFDLEKVDIDSLTSLGSSLVELLQSDDPSSVDSSLLRSTAMNKLLIWKAGISKVLEVTETEIDLLENELKSLNPESRDRFPCSAAAGSLLLCYNAKSSEDVGGSDKVTRPELLQISSDDDNVEKMPLSANLRDVLDNGKEDDIDSPGTATSKFVEPQPLINAVSSCDARKYGTCSEDLEGIQSTDAKFLVPCTYRKVASVSACGDGNSAMENKDGMDANSGTSFYSSADDALYNTIISSNKESAKRTYEVFAKLLPEESVEISNIGVSSSSHSLNGAFIMEKFAEKKRFARFKENILTIKFKALHHLWKEDMRLLSTRKCRPKSHKRFELGLRTIGCGHQKNRSSIRSRFPFPAGNELSLVPTSEMINYTSQLLSDFRNKVHRSTLKMPALILDQKEKVISKFKSSNGLVEDPFAIEKERAMINPWTSEEREVFLEKFAAFGKNFRKIASFFDHKTTADCIEFYYKNHKSDCFEKIKKKNGGKLGKLFTAKTDLMASGKKWNCEANVASFEILNAASVMAHGIAGNRRMRSRNFLLRGYGNMKSSTGDDSITERSSSHDILRDERETVAADVLAGICGSLSSEAMSSCITSSVGPVEANRDGKCMRVRPPCKQPVMPDDIQNIDHETCSDESSDEMDPSDWTDEEKAAFLQAVSSFGKDFAMIAQCVGTRSQDQCKIFFSKARKCLGLDLVHSRPEYIGSIVNDDVNGGRSDTDDACIVETDSVIGTDKSGTKTDEDLPSSVMNTYHDESNPVEARDLSADLNESKDGEVDHVDVNMVSNACVIKGASLLGDDGSRVVLYSSDKSDSVRDLRGKIMSDSIEVRKDEVRDAVTELVSTSEVNKPCHSDSVAEDQMVSKELEGPPTCHNDRDGKHEANTDFVVELKSRNHDSSNTADSSLPSVGNSRSRLTFGAESRSQLSLDKPHFSGLSVVDPFVTANTRLQNTAGAAAEQEKTANRTCVSSCDFQGSRDMSVHSLSNGHNHNPGNLLDEVEPTRILQCYPLQVPVNKEVNMDMSSCSSANALPLVSQKIEHIGDHYKTQLQCLSDSVRTSRNGDVKLFGKILTNSSPTQKLNLTAQGNEENGTHHPKLSCTSASLKSSGHQADEKSALSKFDCVDYQGSLENVPITSHQDGNRVQSGFSSLSDSAIFLAKYPAAFSNYPASAKPEQQSLQAMVENNEQHLNGASAFTTREVNGINSVIDFQMFTNRDGTKVQPFMIDGKHCQDVFSEMKQRINGFEAVSSLQQQGGGMVGMNGVERPDIPHGGVSDPVAAIKMHYSNGGHSATMTREDEAWGGKEGDLGR